MNSDIRLLIVDPSSIVRAEIRQLAVSQGYSFDEAADGVITSYSIHYTKLYDTVISLWNCNSILHLR